MPKLSDEVKAAETWVMTTHHALVFIVGVVVGILLGHFL